MLANDANDGNTGSSTCTSNLLVPVPVVQQAEVALTQRHLLQLFQPLPTQLLLLLRVDHPPGRQQTPTQQQGHQQPSPELQLRCRPGRVLTPGQETDLGLLRGNVGGQEGVLDLEEDPEPPSSTQVTGETPQRQHLSEKHLVRTNRAE